MQQRCRVAVIGLALWWAAAPLAGAVSNPKPEGKSWAPCSFAVDQISAEGNGTTYGSCLACDPTSFKCPPKCQSLIDALYKQCDGVVAPQDFFFDPAHTLNGYFNDNTDVLRVQAQRCGCNESARTRFSAVATLLSLSSAVVVSYFVD
ncbi:hypothetical protein P43SY_012021 [Pythium insidiosum]|uniref:Niemann-Pick C1 N-terminal domain-containing protein n=1 Tax=Pythium insidiosum TaxID=114742 RepID=A0AAD5Q1G6_PYTIN|nr:hypothetical protein P43SY_012021 [Pythium insidiosum]KAJ0391501.1 hypothetical protein ATCC90586_010722 [Pythium insidiosum]